MKYLRIYFTLRSLITLFLLLFTCIGLFLHNPSPANAADIKPFDSTLSDTWSGSIEVHWLSDRAELIQEGTVVMNPSVAHVTSEGYAELIVPLKGTGTMFENCIGPIVAQEANTYVYIKRYQNNTYELNIPFPNFYNILYAPGNSCYGVPGVGDGGMVGPAQHVGEGGAFSVTSAGHYFGSAPGMCELSMPCGTFTNRFLQQNIAPTVEWDFQLDEPQSDADLSLTGTDTPDPARSGENLTYTLTVSNNGPGDATNVKITDTLAEGTTFISATPSQGTCTAATPINCTIGNLSDGSTATVTVVVKPSKTVVGTTVQNTANVTANENDPDASNNSVSVSTLVNSCSAAQLSGAPWAAQFPNSNQLATLNDAFEANTTNFINAMRAAGINVQVIATLRPAQRAYLMHYSWRISNRQIAAVNVPDFVAAAGQGEVDICWTHRNAAGQIDEAASRRAANQLVRAFGIDPNLRVAPALNSRHTEGLAIDMTTTWAQRRINIVDGRGRNVVINNQPHTGLNQQLQAVGATYGVIHFLRAAADPNHWSNDGR